MVDSKITLDVLFENKSIVLSWDNKGSFLHVTWKGYANDQGYLDILAKQLELTKERKASKILYDLRNMGVVSQANQAYTNEKYFPSMSDAGNKKAAIIVPENIFGEVSVSAIMGKRNSELFEAEIFGELDTAREWLVS